MGEQVNWVTSFDWESANAAAMSTVTTSRRLNKFLAAHQHESRQPASPQTERFGRYIQALRKARGWNRQQLARAANLDPVGVVLIENGLATQQELTTQVVRQLLLVAFMLGDVGLVILPEGMTEEEVSQ